MKINTIKSSEFKTTHWSGGDTTQIYIYPPDSDYASRNFLFRISSATVNDEESVFTKLENIDRFLMVIEGRVRLEHTGFHTAELTEYEIDRFLGDWETKSFGCCKDFNLMIKGRNSGSLCSLDIDGIEQNIELKEQNIYVIYSFDTDLELCGLNIESNTAVVVSDIEKGDCVNFIGNGKVIVSRVEIKDRY